MKDLLQFVAVVVGQVSVTTIAVVLLAAFAGRVAVRRHLFAFAGLIVVLGSPAVVLMLPRTTWRWPNQSVHSPIPTPVRTRPAIDPAPVISARLQHEVSPETVSSGIQPIGSQEIPATLAPNERTIPSPPSIVVPDRISPSPQITVAQSVTGDISWSDWILLSVCGVWFGGTCVGVIGWLRQLWCLRHISRQMGRLSDRDLRQISLVTPEVTLTLRLKRLPAIAVSDFIPVPIVLGVWHPVVVIPRTFLDRIGPGEMRDILIHECAHVCRFDPWINAAQRLAAVLWWWHPGVLVLNRILTQSREEICDNYVLQRGDATHYAQTLLELAESISRPQPVAAVVGLLGSPWKLEERIAGLLNPGRNTMTSTRWRTILVTTLVFGLGCLVAGGIRAVEKPAGDAATQESAQLTEATDQPPKNSTGSKPRKPPAEDTDNSKLKTTTLRGTCLDDHGDPVPGSQVQVFRSSQRHVPLQLIAEAVPDEDGKFEIQDVTTRIPDEFDLVVIASSEKHVPHVTGPQKIQDGAIDLKLQLSSNPGTLSGVVTDIHGKPVAGVTVFMPGSGNAPYPGIWTSVTDEKGRYTITNLKRWNAKETESFDAKEGVGTVVSACAFGLSHPDYGFRQAWYSAVPEEVNITLQPPAIVEGRVIDSVTGLPVPDVPVSAQGVARHGWYQTQTDQDGRYHLKMTRDYYNIWSEAEDRIAIAVKALNAEQGKTVAKADISLVKGGFVTGTVFDEDDQPIGSKSLPAGAKEQEKEAVADPAQRHLVAHYGPARPRTGAAVTSTQVNRDGTYRLRVAPGKNYVYLMTAVGHAAFVDVKDGEETKLNFRLSEPGQNSSLLNDPDEKLGRKIRREMELEERRLADAKKNPGTPVAQPNRRAATPAGKLLDQLEEQNSGPELFRDPWCQTLKQIVDLGPAAVPDLVAELDATNDNLMLRCLGFTLRAINDKRAIPALIRTIPKTLLKPGSDMGCRAEDAELTKFMQKYDLDPQSRDQSYSFGRPVREIFAALQKISGHRFDEDQLYSIFLDGLPSQRKQQAELYWKNARRWTAWWEQHWSEHVKDAALSRVNLPQQPVEDVPELKPETRFDTGGGNSNWILESVYSPKGRVVFLDLDTSRIASLPEKWRKPDNTAAQSPDNKDQASKEKNVKVNSPKDNDAKTRDNKTQDNKTQDGKTKGQSQKSQDGQQLSDKQIDEILAWAAGEGFDLMGTEYVVPDTGESVYAIRSIGMRAWELGKNRWKAPMKDFTLESLQAEGAPVEGLLLHFDNDKDAFDLHATGTFLFITREGTPGLLYLGIEVKDDSLKPGGRSTGDNELNPIAFNKGRRLGWTALVLSKKDEQ